ncbi:Tn7-like element transposition protein TnsE [Clostridium butyricum]|uniref:TnsE C-terminal domain-containing protein n=1 Tax=Clostridium butyricum E4 str. BoNT E BL5262 TaxID=632245 RepID=C4IEU4_CLOBU|nr:Tn7-like element transposition protein TnsE [Clostridium butyricum]EDT74297.1 conserved hypothetical protein [Clostridium butyricum 5521]EEP55377.1 conserved hypothetical protein [Clostridium butyricum E4 str. BoNT E BL5262]NFL29696.1 hypothetical protein [Clostridium butyricum]NFS16799.1 hypothetical protein [Clostridium butyricum]
MGERKKLKLDNWPFEKGKKAKLIWIGEPFKHNNKWMLDTYFYDGETTKKVIQDWANLYFLSIDKYYTDGDLRSGELLDNQGVMETININLSGITHRYNENEWSISKSNYKSKSKTFSFWKNNILYTIPIIEIVRAVLAPNTFMLNAILYNDAWEDYFIYNLDDRKLQIHFTNQYKRSYLKNEYYNHLAWMISNEEILKMCSDIGYNILSKEKLIFDFNIHNFNINARAKKNKHGFTIMEILKVNKKEIKVDEMKVYHPSFEQREKSNEAKLRTYTHINNNNDDRTIDSSADGAKDYDERINDELIVQEYIKVPAVKKEKERSGKLRTIEENDTKKYIIDDDNSRTLSSEGGMRKANGIEAAALDETIIPAELSEFIYNLKELEKLDWIEKVDIRIVMLPLGRKFSYLNNGVDRRKCLIVEILKINGDICGILEVQRENKLLSTLILKGKLKRTLSLAYEELLTGLILESGKWSVKVINGLNEKNIDIYRNKHMNTGIDNIVHKIAD